jgi:hypothetical protein
VRVSEHFCLQRGQPFLDFVDVRIDTDIPVFVNPAAIRSLNSQWGSDCISLLQHYFETVLAKIRAGDKPQAIELLASLNERNEFHLGYSRGKSRGHGFGSISGASIWKALSESKAVKSGLIQDLEDTCLMIDGIGPDMVSDAICNIIRGPLITYTQEMCEYYGIPLTDGVNSGPIWNAQNEKWETSFVRLPMTPHGRIVFVPKLIVRFGMWYSVDEYYRYYLLPAMQQDELHANTQLVKTLKSGEKKVTKKSLVEKYGAGKLAVIDQTLKRPSVLAKYKEEKEKRAPHPLTHGDFAEIEGSERPQWPELLNAVRDIPTGTEYASAYEDAIERLLSALFYPSLCSPQKQQKIHNGRKRIDIKYVNAAQEGFFAWLSQHYPAAHIFVECKNYGKEIANPELDQLAGRFSPSRGQVGILICRKIANKALFAERCRDTCNDSRGYIMPLDDDDLDVLVNDLLTDVYAQTYPLLRRLFNNLIM